MAKRSLSEWIKRYSDTKNTYNTGTLNVENPDAGFIKYLREQVPAGSNVSSSQWLQYAQAYEKESGINPFTGATSGSTTTTKPTTTTTPSTTSTSGTTSSGTATSGDLATGEITQVTADAPQGDNQIGIEDWGGQALVNPDLAFTDDMKLQDSYGHNDTGKMRVDKVTLLDTDPNLAPLDTSVQTADMQAHLGEASSGTAMTGEASYAEAAQGVAAQTNQQPQMEAASAGQSAADNMQTAQAE